MAKILTTKMPQCSIEDYAKVNIKSQYVMPRLGQHFLKNRSVIKKIVDALELYADDFVVEIGPGHGELTAAIAGRTRVKIVAIEKDARLAGLLREMFLKKSAANGSEVEILEGDALEVLPKLAPGKIAGNIPYYITGKLLRTMSELERKPERSVLMVQREVAERLCAAPPHMNRLAASVQFWADAKIVANVPKEDFSPAPDVDSAVVLLETKRGHAAGETSGLQSERYYRAVRAIFSQPRKTILNNVVAGSAEKHGKGDVGATIKKFGLDPGARPQNLTIRDIENIAEAFF
jgi:16S rRNA (adenine1518-N6/adenine1519-N6)-dimethyltransferase